jgi:broad specificity phosphatase PhoE
MSTVIAFRHGVYEHNKRIDLTGEAAETVMQERVADDIDYKADLLPDEGFEQTRLLRLTLKLAAPVIELCMTSPYKRTQTAAKEALGRRRIRIVEAPGLRERDLGIFRDLPREKFYEDYPESAKEKKKNPLTWKPLPAPGRPGESLIETQVRAAKEIQRGLKLARTGIIALSTHMDVMVALRGHPNFGGLNNTTIKQPLADSLQNPLWVPNVAVDMYSNENPSPNSDERYRDMRFFRHLNPQADTDTGWLKIR